ncbi:etfa [Scenedesmus sp. PABB004]|nr:etfa [Scenedesmus sp. PABB004]
MLRAAAAAALPRGLRAAAGAARQACTLVLAEHRGGLLAAPTLNALAAGAALAGAGAEVAALVAGADVRPVAEQAAALPGVSRVLLADAPALAHQLAEPLAALLAALVRADAPAAVLAPSSSFGKNVLPRAAALLGVQAVADVVSLAGGGAGAEGGRTFVRPIYAGNGLATVALAPDAPLVMATVRPTAFPRAEGTRAGAPAPIEPVPADVLAAAADPALPQTEWLGCDEAKAERPELGSARVVVSGGRALKSAEGFKQLEALADLLGGAVGASRAAVDAGFVSNDLQVGQTGKVVAPALYIAVGISGAIQHVAGMKDSGVIVAINSDPEAPIFKVADYGLVGDLFAILPELTQAIADAKAKAAAGV